MGAILSKFWSNKSNSNNNNQPQLAITGPPPRLPLPAPPPPPIISSSQPVDKNSETGEDKSTNHGRKSSKKQQQQQQQYEQKYHQQPLQQQSGQQLEKSSGKNILPLSKQSFIYKTVLEATVSDAKANEEEARINAAEAPGPFEIETDLLSPEVEEAVIKIQANVRGYLTRKQYRGVTPDRSIETSQQSSSGGVGLIQEPIESPIEPRSSGILAPPPSFSDTPKEFPLDHDDNQIAASQGKKIAEKLIELEKQVSQQQTINKPSELTATLDEDGVNVYRKKEQRKEENSGNRNNYKQSPVDCCFDDKLKFSRENKLNVDEDIHSSSSQRPLGIPSIETSEFSGPEEAAIKIQAAFRGYQVRKTISRETSPCPNRGDEEEEVVHLREKDGNSTQDPERESILVLNQLEECLSQELMRSSIHLGDEASLSSYSTDLDLNSSLQSNVSLSALASTSQRVDENADLKLTSNKSVEETATLINNQQEKTLVNEPPLPSSTEVTIPDEIKSESVNNEQIVATSSIDSSSISIENQVPIDFPTTDCPVKQTDCLDSPKSEVEDESETIESVSTGEKDNTTNDGTVLIDEMVKKANIQEIDPVVIVELNGTVDASNISKSNEQPIEDELKIIKLESPKQLTSSDTELKQLDEEKKFNVDCESMAKNVNNATIPINDLNQPTETIDAEPEIEPLFSEVNLPSIESTTATTSNNQQIVTNDPVKSPLKVEQITSPIPDLSLAPSLPETVTSNNQSDLNFDENTTSSSLIGYPVGESIKKVIKLTKEDSFESDILILDDEKSDTLYDPFDVNLTGNSSTIQESTVNDEQFQATPSSSFVEDNLIQSVVDDLNIDEGLLLYEISSASTVNKQQTVEGVKLPDMSENINEIKDDILVNLDESEDEDDDSQKRQAKESENYDSMSTITMNAQCPGEGKKDDQSMVEKKMKDLSDSSTSVEVVQSDEQSNVQSKSLAVDNNTTGLIDTEISSLPEKLEAKMEATTINKSPDVPKVTSFHEDEEKVITTDSFDLQLEKQLNIELAFSPNVENNQQSTFLNHDNSSIQEIDPSKISTNPFLNQPDFDSDLEMGKIIPSDQKPSNSIADEIESSKDEQPLLESTKTVQQSEPSSLSSPEIETVNNKEKDANTPIGTKENKQTEVIVEPSIVDEETIQIDETTDLNAIQENDAKVDELPTTQDNPSSSTSSSTLSYNLNDKFIVSQTEPSNQPNNGEQLTPQPMESSTSSVTSLSPVNQQTAVIIEPSVDPENVEMQIPPIKASPAPEESGSKPEEEEEDEASPEKGKLFLRLQERENRSRSPNPFGRKNRRHKKNRGGAH